MKRTILALAVAAVVLPVFAQQATQRGSDGAISVARPSDAGGSTAGAQPPLVIVGGKRQTGTDWVAPATGEISIDTNSGRRNVRLNPKGGEVSLNGGAAASAPTVMRNGATSRWMSKSRECPAFYSGSITWQVEEVQTVTNPAWTETGATRNYAENCTAVVETRWIGQSAACPTGWSGSNTWEAEERRAGGGAWSATGATRAHSNACTEPAPPKPDPVPPVTVPPVTEPGSPSPGAGCTKGAAYAFVAPAGSLVQPPATCGAHNRGMQAFTRYRILPQNFNAGGYGQSCSGGPILPLTGSDFTCTSSGWRLIGQTVNCTQDQSLKAPEDWRNQSNWFTGMIEAYQAELDAKNAGWPGMPGGANAMVMYSCARVDVP